MEKKDMGGERGEVHTKRIQIRDYSSFEAKQSMMMRNT
jgi:hypothetical protein